MIKRKRKEMKKYNKEEEKREGSVLYGVICVQAAHTILYFKYYEVFFPRVQDELPLYS
jgi:hypothetical protein